MTGPVGRVDVTRRRLSTKARVSIFTRANGICHLCGGKITPGEAWDVSHEIPERPGVAERRVYKDSPQGLGRIGGTMMARLQKAGLVRLSSGYGSNWHPTRAVLTDAGRAALKEGRNE